MSRKISLAVGSMLAVTLGALSASGLVACQSSSAPQGSTASSATLTNDMKNDSTRTVQKTDVGTNPGNAGQGTALVAAPGHELAAFAEGCFWGTENTFRHVPGVTATAVGYSGGHTDHPTYETVCSHTTGHAETLLVEFDPKVVTYDRLLDVFYKTHDPTTKNRQGPDIGDQYRSAIFTFSDEQAKHAHAAVEAWQKKFDKPITTEISAIAPFWKAEDYHQQYDEKSGHESCPLPGGWQSL